MEFDVSCAKFHVGLSRVKLRLKRANFGSFDPQFMMVQVNLEPET